MPDLQLCVYLLLMFIRSWCTLDMDQVYGVEMCQRICQQIECCSESYDEKLLRCLPNPILMETGPTDPVNCSVLTRRVRTRIRGMLVLADCVKGYTGDLELKATTNSLFEAYSTGDICLVRFILTSRKQSTDLEQRYERGFTILMQAAHDGNQEMFELFIREGASLSVKSDSKKSLLMIALDHRNIDIARYLLINYSVDVNSAEIYGQTALMYSCYFNDSSIFQLILAAGGDVNAVDGDDNSVLFHACFCRNIDIVRYILTQYNTGKYQSISNDVDKSLMNSILSGYIDIVDLLVKNGADLTIIDSNSSSMLALACQSRSSEMVEYVLSRKCVPVDSRDRYGKTAFLFAACIGTLKILKILLQNECNPRVVDNDLFNVLHYCSKCGNLEMTEFILENRFIEDINSRTLENDLTALLLVAESNNTDVFDLLVSSGADVAAVDMKKRNTLHMACQSGQINMVRHILQLSQENVYNIHHPSVNSRGNEGSTPLSEAVFGGFIDIADLLVRYGGDTNSTDEFGNTLLHLAVVGGHIDAVRHVATKYNVSVERKGVLGQTPILTAAYFDKLEIFKYLVTTNCNKEAVDSYGNNIFHLACSGGRIRMVKYIHEMKYFSNLELRGWQGKTPMLLATDGGYREVFEYLFGLGCNMNATDEDGNNALHLAIMEGHKELAIYLIKKDIVDKSLKNRYGMTPSAIADKAGYKDVF